VRTTFRYILPLLVFIALIFLLGKGLLTTSLDKSGSSQRVVSEPESLPIFTSTSIPNDNAAEKNKGEYRRSFRLQSLMEPSKVLTQDIFKDKVTLLNVWASWCGPCRAGQETLVALSKHPQSGSIFWAGLNINDTLDEAQRMLQIYGNPYQDVIYDPKGRLAVNLGIRGTPALLILDKKGSIRYRHYGPINISIWEEEILPLIKELQEG